jgi:hypothetical protein
MEVAVYGAIAAFHASGYHPSEAEIAWTANHSTTRHAQRAITALVGRHLLRRCKRGTKNVYDLLGPTLEPQPGEKAC